MLPTVSRPRTLCRPVGDVPSPSFGVAPPALTTILFLLSLRGAFGAPGDAGEAVWPQWRGPDRDGHVSNAQWPESLDHGRLRRAWHVDGLGPSYSGPVVTADRVFVTETRDGKEEVVRALVRSTGKVDWELSWPGSMSVPFFARKNGSWIRSTPAWDGERLYVAGMRDVLVCLDGSTGRELWRVDFVKRFETPLPSFGFVCSPLLDETGVYVQAGASLVKLDRHTGETLWRSLEDGGGMYGSAFSSPVLVDLHDRSQLLVQTRTRLCAVDPTTGEALWSREVPAFRGMSILTPIPHGETVFTSSYGGGSFLTGIEKGEGGFEASEIWKRKEQGYMSTPVLVEGRVYMHLRNRRITCLNLATGESHWTTTERFGEYMSLVTDGKLILGLDERGLLLLFRASPERFELLDSRRVSDSPAWAHLAVCGDTIFVRDLHGVSAWVWRSASAAKQSPRRLSF